MKTKWPRFAGLSLVSLLCAALVVASAPAGTTGPQPGNVKQMAVRVMTLAMDGPRVAYMRVDRRVGVWNVLTGTTTVIEGTYPSKGNFGPGNGEGYGEVAIAGKRVAMITRWVIGNSQESQERLYTAPLGGPVHQLGSHTLHSTGPQCFDCGDPGFADGTWIAGLVGSGKTLAVSTWKSAQTVSSGERLRLVTPGGLRTIVAGPGAAVAESADAGRIAVLRSTAAWPADDVGPPTSVPTVGIYSAQGRLLRELAPSRDANKIALSGKRLVVLTKTFPPTGGVTSTFEVYDWTTATLLHTWTPQTSCGTFSVSGQLLACFGETQRLHLLDLTTGKDVVIAQAPANSGCVTAMDSRGLVYSVDVERSWTIRGKLVFVPTAKLLGALSE